VPPPYHLCAAC